MPPLHAPRQQVPDITVPLTPALTKHYWQMFAALRELYIIRGEQGAAMKCQKRMQWLEDEYLRERCERARSDAPR